MAASNWEQKKKHALDLLQRLLDIWQARRPLNKIISTGPECNNAVLALGQETDLPLPYDEEEMSGTSLAAIFEAKDRSGGPDDELSKNINAWIQLIEKTEYKAAAEKIEITLEDLENPVPCTEVSGITRIRSDNIARTLKSHKYPVVKSGGKYYCNAEHAAVLWPKWKKYLKERQVEE